MIDLVALKTEIDTDPEGLGYAGKQDAEIASLMNDLAVHSETVNRQTIAAWELLASTDITELAALTADKRAFYDLLVQSGELSVSDDALRQKITGLFGVGSTTRSNLAARVVKSASRAEALFGAPVTHIHVAEARSL